MVKVKLPKIIKTSLGQIQRRSPRYSAPKLVKKESSNGFTEQNEGSSMNSDANGTSALPCNLGNYSTLVLNTGDSQVVVCPETLTEGSEFPLESSDVNSTSSSTYRLSYHSIQDSHFIPSKVDSQVTHCSGTPSSTSGSSSRNSFLLPVNFPHDSHEIFSRVNSQINTIAGTLTTINDSPRDSQVRPEVSTMNSESSGNSFLPFNLHNYSSPVLNPGDSQVIVCAETVTEGSEFPLGSSNVNPTSSSTSRLLYHSIQDSHFIPSEGNSQATHCSGTPSSISGSTLCNSLNSDLQKTRNTKNVSRKNMRKTKVSLVDEKTKKQKGRSDNACKTCDKKFASRQNVKLHEKIHLGVKNHKCNLCGFSFVQKSHLEDHIRFKHTKEKPYKCQVENCRSAFHASGNLKTHQLVHNKNDESLKKYQCSVCSYKTVRKPDLKKHQKQFHSNIRDFKCPFARCKYAAKRRSTLNRHIKRKHKNQSPPSSSVSSAVCVSLESLEVIQEEDEEAEPLVDMVAENPGDEISAGENLIQGEEVETTLTGQNAQSNFSIIGHSLDSRGSVVYVVQENSGNSSSSSFKYFSSKQVREKFPLLVINFFDANSHYWKCPDGCKNEEHKALSQ